MDGSKNVIEEALEAREMVDLAKRVCSSLHIPDKPEAISAEAKAAPRSATRFLEHTERKRLITAVWENDPTGFYLALAHAIQEQEAPVLDLPPADIPTDNNWQMLGTSPSSYWTSQQNSLMNCRWTYLRSRQNSPAHEQRLAAALATWGQATIEEGKNDHDHRLAVSTVRTAFEVEGTSRTPAFARQSTSPPIPPTIRFPKRRKPTTAIRELHRLASRRIITDYLTRDITFNENGTPPPTKRFGEASIPEYASVATRLGEAHTVRWLQVRVFSPQFFNTTLNMHAQHFPSEAAEAEMVYRAVGANLPLLIPGATAARLDWLNGPKRGPATQDALRPMATAIVRRYHDKSFTEQAAIYFQCWLRALADNRIAPQELPNVYTSYMRTPDDLIMRAPGYWPGPYHGEKTRYAIIRVNIPTLVSQCLREAAGQCRPR